MSPWVVIYSVRDCLWEGGLERRARAIAGMFNICSSMRHLFTVELSVWAPGNQKAQTKRVQVCMNSGFWF